MKDLIFNGNVYSDSELLGYLNICNSENDWVSEEYTDDIKAKRKAVYLNENYENVDINKLISVYSSSLPEIVRLNFLKKLKGGFSADYKISKYEPGDDFNWHCDEYAVNEKNTSWKRVISTITYLNDDYEGGETEFTDLIIKPEYGKTLIFPSNWCFPHKGNKVKKGIKYILVIHIWV
jgi:hypothetical protein